MKNFIIVAIVIILIVVGVILFQGRAVDEAPEDVDAPMNDENILPTDEDATTTPDGDVSAQ
jgi:hypothetical protein